MRHPFEMETAELLVSAVCQRNGAACHEIVRRQVKSRKPFVEFLREEIGNHQNHQTDEQIDPTLSEDIAKTLVHVKKAIKGADIDDSDDPDPICRLAREFLAFDPPFIGQTMRNPENAEKYIYAAADNPCVASELPPAGLAFWRAAPFDFTAYRAKHRRGPRA